MRLIPLCLTLLLLVAAPPLAAAEDGVLRLGDDVFAAGNDVTINSIHAGDGGTFPVVDDVFLAGDRVALTARPLAGFAALPPAIGGSAHLAGRRVAVEAGVAGDVYAAGYEVTTVLPVEGDATLAGYEVTAGPVAGDLRAAGRRVTLAGPVGGYAALAGDRVTVDAPVAGDLALTAREVTFGPEARVGGRVILIAEAGEPVVAVPDRVAPADRVERVTPVEADARPDVPAAIPRPAPAADRGFGATLVTLALLVALVTLAALLLPDRMARARTQLLARPWAALAVGAAAISALMGSVILAASTVVGLVLVPILLLAIPVAGLAGYVVGAHALGVRITAALGLAAPVTAPAQARAAAAGVLALALAGLVPLLGWIVLLAVSLAGLAMLVPSRARSSA